MKLPEIKKQIIATFLKFDPEKIILFGSAGRQEWDEYSDVDIIVVYETEKSFLDRLRELYLSWNIPKAVDILGYTPKEFNTMLNNNYFIQDALREGEIIYERFRA